MGDLPLFDPFKALEEARREAPRELSQKLSQDPATVNHEQDHEVSSTFATSAAFADPSNGPTDFRSPSLRERERFSSFFSNTYARNECLTDATSEHGRHTPAKPAKPAKETLSHSEFSHFPENGAAKVIGPLLRKWQVGLATLTSERAPCPDYRGTDWSRVYANALAFLDTFGAQAEALGWQTHELFGVHPEVGTGRPDHCGALVLTSGGAVRAITADTIRFDRATYRRAPGQSRGVPIWEIGQ